jgi:hypothetical protein
MHNAVKRARLQTVALERDLIIAQAQAEKTEALEQQLASGNQSDMQARCAFSDRNLHSRMPLRLTPLLLLKRCHAYDRCHSSRMFTSLTG